MPARTQTVTAFNLTEAAKKVGVSRWTMHRAIKEGRLTAHRSGRSVIIFSADLLDWVLSYRGGAGIEEEA
jgi:excisionase family DNA binding protein